MKKALTLSKILSLSFLLLTASTFVSCSTGTDPGETNVEHSGAKDAHEKSGTEQSGEGVRHNETGADR